MPAAKKPVPKIQAAGVSGAIAVLAVFIAGQLDVEMSAEVGAAIATVVAYAGGYVKASA